MPTTSSDSSLADRLKLATAEQHRRAEERPLQRAMAAGTISPAAYAHWSVAMLAVHAALDRGLDALRIARGDLDGLDALVVGHARHVRNLELDVAGAASVPAPIGPAAAAVVADLEHRATTEPIALLGSLYVLEGSMNGNRFIAARLADAWGVGEPPRYLVPDGDEQRPRWLAWRAGLDALPLTAADQAAIEGAAAAMFDGITALSDEIAPDA
jgi:heme oxygenase